MRPKKIYIRPEGIQTGQDWDIFSDHATKEHTAEYVDLSQVWHTGGEGLDFRHHSHGGVIVQYENGCISRGAYPDAFLDCANPKVKRWAYVKDLLPKGGAE